MHYETAKALLGATWFARDFEGRFGSHGATFRRKGANKWEWEYLHGSLRVMAMPRGGKAYEEFLFLTEKLRDGIRALGATA